MFMFQQEQKFEFVLQQEQKFEFVLQQEQKFILQQELISLC